MLAGVTIVDRATTWIEPTVTLEPDAVVHPFTVLRAATTVAADAQVGPHVVAVDAAIGPGALVGPFCYLRPGTVLGASSKAGTFVELKNTRLGEGTKVPHLRTWATRDRRRDERRRGAITANYPHASPAEGRPPSGVTSGSE
jgi:bifunctional UDP-N-acetylglucosamine pyrophosphorylase/glucosamine-1-phosphate N-acetyltransferase